MVTTEDIFNGTKSKYSKFVRRVINYFIYINYKNTYTK